ncbi:hypothetical protein GBAR_LOCUS23648 [Geodia barretti]|uniref:Uncharacterized protein n=1 Tax=Geodia barretti TaxID=519541 RepID=A0AA35T6H2_GEOBA|nr:hypothetical protein GBAR_LOCUS23648 [Geodia barretti]
MVCGTKQYTSGKVANCFLSQLCYSMVCGTKK